MAEKKKVTYEKLITPKGFFVYPWLTKPDTRFNPEGTYSCNLAIPEADAKGLMKKLDDLLEKHYQDAVKAAKPQDKNKLKKADPYVEQYNEQDEPTGNILFKTKMKATVTSKSGETFTQSPKLFDAHGKPLPKSVSPYGGTEGKLSVQIVPYVMASTKEVGLSLRLQAAQIIKLVQGGQGGDAGSYGFGQEEGYTADEESTFEETTEAESEDF